MPELQNGVASRVNLLASAGSQPVTSTGEAQPCTSGSSLVLVYSRKAIVESRARPDPSSVANRPTSSSLSRSQSSGNTAKCRQSSESRCKCNRDDRFTALGGDRGPPGDGGGDVCVAPSVFMHGQHRNESGSSSPAHSAVQRRVRLVNTVGRGSHVSPRLHVGSTSNRSEAGAKLSHVYCRGAYNSWIDRVFYDKPQDSKKAKTNAQCPL